MSVVQQVGFDGGQGTSAAITIGASTAGNTIIVASQGGAGASGAPTDNLGTTWPASTLVVSGSPIFMAVWVLQNCPAGITTITVHQNDPCGWVAEENGVLATSLDQFASQQFTGTAVTSGNTATLSQANEVSYGFAANNNNITYTAGSGWSAAAFTNQGGSGTTVVGNQENTAFGPNILFIERQVVTSTAALAATMTQVGGGLNGAAIITLMQGSVAAPVVSSLSAFGIGPG